MNARCRIRIGAWTLAIMAGVGVWALVIIVVVWWFTR